MAMETVSTKRRRTYPRKFDHEEAIRMHKEEKFSASGIARLMGVSVTAIQRVVDPEFRKKLDSRVKQYSMSGTCVNCGKPRALASEKGKLRKVENKTFTATGLCRTCWARSRQTRFRRNETDEIVEVRCGSCEEWKSVSHFQKNKRATEGINNHCRSCATRKRRERRWRQSGTNTETNHPATPMPRASTKKDKPKNSSFITEEEREASARRDAQWSRKGM